MKYVRFLRYFLVPLFTVFVISYIVYLYVFKLEYLNL